MIEKPRVYTWDVSCDGQMALDTISLRHSKHFWVRRSTHSQRSWFTTATRALTLYVISGHLQYRTAEWELTIGPGQFVALAEGTYDVRVLGVDEVVGFGAWEMPADWVNNDLH